MYNSKAIREKIAELFAAAEALNALAQEEKRDLTDEEQGEFDGLLNQIGNDGSNGEAKSGLWADVEKAEKFESIKARLSAPLNQVPNAVLVSGDIKPKVRERRNLKAFKGRTEDAYRAGRWIAGALLGDDRSRKWCSENGVAIRAAMSGDSNSKGGFLVPDEMSQAVIDLRESYGVFRRWSRVVPMGSDHMNIPRRKSGVTAYAVGENDSITASDKEWSNVELTAKKWGVLVKYSSELAEDSFIDMADDLASEMAYAFALKEDQSGFVGDGTSTYHGVRGVMNLDTTANASSIHTALAGNTAFSTLDLVDFEAALGKVPQYAIDRGMAAWFISRVGFFASMARLMDAAGGNSNMDLGAGPGMVFLGLPVVISQVMNSTTAAQTDTNLCCVGDLSLASTIGDRRDFTVMVSNDRYFENDQIGIKGTVRTAVKVHDLGTTSGGDAGPVVVLRTPGA